MPKRNKNHHKPEGIDTSLHYRAIPLKKAETGGPATLDETTRSVEIIVATEAPVMVFDWERWEMVPEILLMSGCQMPASGQVPLLDTHMRYDTSTVIGSVRGLEVQGAEIIGRAYYSAAPEAEGPYLKMTEGHLTDYSAGYRYNKKDAIYVPDGQSAVIDGRTFTGPAKVVRSWQLKETSACPIGADELAKARAATPPVNPIRTEEREMDQKIRAFLESRGLSKDATEEEALRFLETLEVRTPQPGAGGQRSEDDIRADATRAEQTRIGEIRGICARANMSEEETMKYIRDNASVETVRQAAFDKVTAQGHETPGFRGSMEIGADARDKFRSAAEGSLIIRAASPGLVLSDQHRQNGARDLAGFSLRELAREALRVAGQPITGNPLEMVGRALTSSDLPTVLGNIANLSIMEGWEAAGETWGAWCGTGSVSDFKVHTMARVGESDDLDEIPEDGEYKRGSESEQKEQYQVVTFGKLFSISRQGIINDDLGLLTDKPRSMGEAAARKVGDLPYAVLIANANMGDGVALFHTATHKNLAAGSDKGLVDVPKLGVAEAAMGMQKDIRGKRRLNIRPQFFLSPLTQKASSEQFFRSSMIGTQASPNITNIYGGDYFTRVYEPRLDDSSTKAWYLAGPKGKTVIVFFLNGNQTPYMETKQGWNVDGVEFKVRIDAGAKAKDWKGLYKNPGE